LLDARSTIMKRQSFAPLQAVLITELGLGHRAVMMYRQDSFGLEPKAQRASGSRDGDQGGCLCGAVRYTAEADPTSATVCHCRDCQKFTGSAFATLVRATKDAVTIEAPSRHSAASAAAGIRSSGTSAPNVVRQSPRNPECGPV